MSVVVVSATGRHMEAKPKFEPSPSFIKFSYMQPETSDALTVPVQRDGDDPNALYSVPLYL